MSSTNNANHGQPTNTDWHRVWSDFNEGMKRLTEMMRQMEKTYEDTYVWDRPIVR